MQISFKTYLIAILILVVILIAINVAYPISEGMKAQAQAPAQAQPPANPCTQCYTTDSCPTGSYYSYQDNVNPVPYGPPDPNNPNPDPQKSLIPTIETTYCNNCAMASFLGAGNDPYPIIRKDPNTNKICTTDAVSGGAITSISMTEDICKACPYLQWDSGKNQCELKPQYQQGGQQALPSCSS